MTAPKLLVVEDEVLLQDILSMVLAEGGFEVTLAIDGRQAIAELESDPSAFSAMITDVRLPGGMDGWAVARHAREVVSDIPVLYVTGDSEHSWSTKGVPQSVLLPKPFGVSELNTAISTLIASAASPR
jgi:DNA-binding response OmpR family regulator